jgi:hypothetical protein
MDEKFEYLRTLVDPQLKKIDKSLLLFEEIFPMDMTELRFKYPKLDSIIEKYRNNTWVVTADERKMLQNVMIDINNLDSVTSLRRDIAESAREIYAIIFPETGTERFVKFCTDQKSLEDYQQVLIAPAKWIERAVWWIISLLNPQTYVELKAWTRYMSGHSFESTLSTIRIIYEQFKKFNTTQQTSIWIEYLISVISIFWIAGKIWQVLSKYKTLSKIAVSSIAWQSNLRDFVRIHSFIQLLD